ncbi:MAG: phosphate ABC transporter ATP-binding protein PstB [Chloroflexota bacterium]
MTTEAKIVVENLNLYYGRHHALKGVNVGFQPHVVTAIIGPSGCGKSTLLRTLNRMNDLIADVRVEGTVALDGENVYRPGIDLTALRKRIGMVFQRPTAFPLSVFDNVAAAPRIHGITKRSDLEAIVERSLRQAGLWEDVKDGLGKPGLSLSLGQQQQLSLARVLALDPEVVLLDEPASALDPLSTLRLEDLMQTLKDKYTFVIVTHNMQQAARASDWTLFMMGGERIEYGPTQDLFTSPRDRRTDDYINGRFG